MLDFLAAFLTAALSATGVGGGGLLILYLRLVKNIPQVTSQGINLIFFTVSSACAAVVHFFRRKLRLQTVLICGIFGFCGAFLGFARFLLRFFILLHKSVKVNYFCQRFLTYVNTCQHFTADNNSDTASPFQRPCS